MISELQNLLDQDKFSDSVWLERGLNPCDKALCLALKNTLNEAIQHLLELPSTSPELEKVNSLKSSLLSFDRLDLDTVEKELIADYFSNIAQIVNIYFDTELDIWMYGFSINKNSSPKPIIIEKTISESCSKCKALLNTDILKERKGVSSFWLIAQCNNCNEFNLLSFPENIDRYIKGNYFVFDTLKEKAYSLEQAIEKMKFYKYNSEE